MWSFKLWSVFNKFSDDTLLWWHGILNIPILAPHRFPSVMLIVKAPGYRWISEPFVVRVPTDCAVYLRVISFPFCLPCFNVPSVSLVFSGGTVTSLVELSFSGLIFCLQISSILWDRCFIFPYWISIEFCVYSVVLPKTWIWEQCHCSNNMSTTQDATIS